jgi:hypothetical protein
MLDDKKKKKDAEKKKRNRDESPLYMSQFRETAKKEDMIYIYLSG